MIVRHEKQSRPGFTMIIVLVILAVLTSLMALAAQNAATARRMLNHRADQLQAQWLAQAGLELAAAKLRANPKYQGDQLELISNGQLTVKVEAGSADGLVNVTSTATCSKLGLAPTRVELTRSLSKP